MNPVVPSNPLLTSSGAHLAVLSTLLLVLTACDTSSTNEPGSAFDGRWQGAVPVTWTQTYDLPAGASADSVRYDHVGLHEFTVDLREDGGVLRGTVDWDWDGAYVVTTYSGGALAVERDEVAYDAPSVSATATRDGATLVFDPGDNDWIQGTGPVELTLRDGRLEGTFLQRYLTQTWSVSGAAQVETRFDVPVGAKLVRGR